MRGAPAHPHRCRGGVLHDPRHDPSLLREGRRELGDRARRARPLLGPGRRLSRPQERDRRGCADVRDARHGEAGDAHLSGRSSFGQAQAEIAPMDMDPLGYETGSPPLQRANVAGRVVSFRESGYDNERVLVLLHGVSSLAASWGPQFVSLPSRGYRVIAWDAPGYGGSDPLPQAEPAPADYAEALRGFVDAIGLKRFFLLGHSLGALPAAAFCNLTGTARVQKLILAAPTPGYATATDELRRARVD